MNDVTSNEIEELGFAIVPQVIEALRQAELISVLGPVSGAGRRGLLNVPAVAALCHSAQLLDLVRSHLPSEPLPVRAIYFDKSPKGNWLVPWHQDLTLAVRNRADVSGFGPWSVKHGVPHVQPPVELLEQMLTVRIHLDDADESNGALRVLPGSHRLDRLSAERIQELRASESICAWPALVTPCSCAHCCSTRPAAPQARSIAGCCILNMQGSRFRLNSIGTKCRS